MNTPLPATDPRDRPISSPSVPSPSAAMDSVGALAAQLSRDLSDRHGPILGGEALASALGYRSLAALRQARRRGQVEVKLFALPQRRGVFALSVDVARWLAQARERGLAAHTTQEDTAKPDHT